MNIQSTVKMSFEDYLAWESAQEEKHELVGGRPVLRRLRLMAGETETHAQIVANLIAALKPRLSGGACRVFGSDFKIRSPTGNARNPDVMIECGAAGPKDSYATEPRVLVEVLSPSNDALDQVRLLEDYQAFPSAQHVAFFAQDKLQALVWTRKAGGWTRMDLEGLDASLDLSALGVSIPFAEIYDGVAFEAQEE